MSAASMTRVVFQFEWLRYIRNGSLLVLIAITALVALALSFTLGPNTFPVGMSMKEWFTTVVPNIWYWVCFPICGAIVAAQVGGSDITSGSLRLVLTTSGVRRALVYGKLAAVVVALMALNSAFAVIGLIAILYHGFSGSITGMWHVTGRFLAEMFTGYFGAMVWPVLVFWLAVRLGSNARAGGAAGILLVAGWAARGQFGSDIEPYLVPFWGGAMLEKPLTMLVPVAVALALTVFATSREMRLLEVR